MTRKEKQILKDAKEYALVQYEDFKHTRDDDVRQSPEYRNMLNVYLTVASEYCDLLEKLGID